MNHMALQLERIAFDQLVSGSNIVFDSIIHASGNISYNSISGEVTFNEVGKYLINWLVATQTAISTDAIVFALRTSQGDNIEGNSPIKTGEVYGVGVIEIITPGVTLSLVNSSTGATGKITLSSMVPVKASMAIVSVDEQGAVGSGSIIPYTSGTPVVLTTLASGLAGNTAAVGYGTNAAIVGALGTTIDLTGSTGILLNMVFSIPRAGMITSIAAYFSNVVALSLSSNRVVLSAQLYQATTPDNTFTAINRTSVLIEP